MKKKDIDKIVKQNPHVDERRLEEIDRVMDELRRFGVKPTEYNLVHPFARPVGLTRKSDNQE